MKQNKNFLDHLDGGWGDVIADTYSSYSEGSTILIKWKKHTTISIEKEMSDYNMNYFMEVDKVLIKFNDLGLGKITVGDKKNTDYNYIFLRPKSISYTYYLNGKEVYKIDNTLTNFSFFKFNFKLYNDKLEFDINNDYFKLIYLYQTIYNFNGNNEIFEFIEFSKEFKTLLLSVDSDLDKNLLENL